MEDIMLETAIQAAKEAGTLLRDGYKRLTGGQIHLKGKGDYVTELDRLSEETIIRIIKASWPDHGIIAEESGSENSEALVRWIIDPLDGTANYVRGIPVFAVSIGIMAGDELTGGVIYNPVLEELFTAEKGKGARLNGNELRIADPGTLDRALLATGFPWRFPEAIDAYTEGLAALIRSAGGIRRLGAAAVDLAYTACGIFDGFWEMRLKPWDIAAGAVIVREAGGIVTDMQGGDSFLESGNVIAAAPRIHAALLEKLRGAS
ncbi:inositol monophosphatase [bacterium]|nr:inositol monophosphatase [bacterium]